MTGNLFALSQLGVGDAVVPVRPFINYPSFDSQPIGRQVEMFGTEFQQHLARLGAGRTQGRAEKTGRHGTEGAHVPGTQIGITHHHIDRFQCHIQLLGQHLRQGGHHPLTHLNFAGIAGHPAVFADPQKSIEIRGQGRTARAFLGPCRHAADSHENKDTAAENLEKLAPVDRGIYEAFHEIKVEMIIIFHIIDLPFLWLPCESLR